MKQNKMMRTASVLLAGVLLTTSSVASTYAKYTTKGQLQESAKVARWGVSVVSEGKLFDSTYLSGDKTGGIGNGVSDGENNAVLSVESTGNVVTPGTKNDTGLTFKVEGKPEVDVEVKVTASTEKGDVFLNGIKLPDVSTASEEDYFSVENYFPVKYTLSRNGVASEENRNLTLSQLIAKLKGLTGRYDAGTDLSGSTGFGTYTITWEWMYDGNDQADSLLGTLLSGISELDGITLKEGSHYNLETDLSIEVTVTQID